MNSDTTVRDVMHREFLGVSESDSLGDAASLMLSEEADCLVVVRGGEPIGSLSPRDALETLLDGADPETTTVGDVMMPAAPTVSIDEQLEITEDRLVSEGARRVIATADEEAVGVVTAHDVLAASRARSDRDTPATTGGAEAAQNTESMTQSICEVCGSLTSELSRSNGQLVCPDCLEV